MHKAQLWQIIVLSFSKFVGFHSAECRCATQSTIGSFWMCQRDTNILHKFSPQFTYQKIGNLSIWYTYEIPLFDLISIAYIIFRMRFSFDIRFQYCETLCANVILHIFPFHVNIFQWQIKHFWGKKSCCQRSYAIVCFVLIQSFAIARWATFFFRCCNRFIPMLSIHSVQTN